MLPHFKLQNLIFVLGTALWNLACASTPTGRHQLILTSEDQVEDSGRHDFMRMKRRNHIVANEADNKFVQCVVDALSAKISPSRPWEVVIFDAEEANAFALPGYKVGINYGLLRVTANQDQLAAVLGHEMGHVIAQHTRERMSQQFALKSYDLASRFLIRDRSASLVAGAVGSAVQIGILYPFSKMQESEADLVGIDLASQAGFNPDEAISFWENMNVYGSISRDSFFSSHPSNQERIANLKEHISAAALDFQSNSNPPQCELQ